MWVRWAAQPNLEQNWCLFNRKGVYNMKKLLSIILCAIMLIAMASPAFANEPINDNVNVGLEAYANEVIAEYIPISMEPIDETDTFFWRKGTV